MALGKVNEFCYLGRTQLESAESDQSTPTVGVPLSNLGSGRCLDSFRRKLCSRRCCFDRKTGHGVTPCSSHSRASTTGWLAGSRACRPTARTVCGSCHCLVEAPCWPRCKPTRSMMHAWAPQGCLAPLTLAECGGSNLP
jgi:hypothetical protein